MGEQNIFKRYEIKYMLTRSQFEAMDELLREYTVADEHGKIRFAACILIRQISCL